MGQTVPRHQVFSFFKKFRYHSTDGPAEEHLWSCSSGYGWDTLPLATDTTLEADIVRIKCYRNTVYGHASQASVDDVTFNQYWQDIQDALVRLGGAGYQSAINDLKKECMDPDIKEHYKELLKQWVVDEVSIKERLDEIGKSLDELKEAIVNPKKRAGDKGIVS